MKFIKIALLVAGSILAILFFAAGIYIYRNLNYHKAPLRRTMRAGFVERQAVMADGSILNYAEGPDNGPALLLIHGQAVSWEDYADVLPALAKHYHVFAVDCHGHGKSSKDPDKYSAEAMGKDFVWFIENVIGEPAVVSGHSSGGLLAAWLAANSPHNVRGVVLEDPPFFSSEASRAEKTFAWVDSFEPIHRFLAQDEQDDFPLFYLENCYWLHFFGDGREGILQYARSYRAKHPQEKLEIFFLPPSITRIFQFIEAYDPRFGETFHDGSWMTNFDHAETLSRIDLPSVLIHASWQYDQNGILLAAMSGEDAERAHSLIPNNVLINVVSGHDVHAEKPNEFTRIMIAFLDEIQ
jgi:pimeloyl-ACP methyl ester carboxylesterase